MTSGPRTLTDADVGAICDELESRFADRFYSNVGKGVFAWVKKGLFAVLLALAAYGLANGGTDGVTQGMAR